MNHILSKTLIVLMVLLCGCSIIKRTGTTKHGINNASQVSIPEEKEIEFEYLLVEGLKQKVVGDIDAAKKYFKGCLEINPQAASVMYELANLYVAKGDLLEAKSLLEKAVVINPDNKWYKLLLAQIYQKDQNYAAASEIFKQLISASPDNTDYYYMNAMLLTSAEKYDEAIKAYNELEKQVGYNEQIALARQQLFRQMGKKKEAYAELQQLIDSDPSVPEYYGIMADMYKEDGDMKKSLEYYNKVLEKDPENGFVQFSLANYYALNKEPEKAFLHAKSGFMDPEVEIETKIQLYLMLTSAPEDIKLNDSQVDTLTSILCDAHPKDARSFGVRADFLVQHGRKAEAREVIAKALASDANNYSLWEQLVLLDNDLGDYDNMIADCGKATELFPNQPLIYVLHSVALIQKKKYSEALETLNTGQVYVVDNKKLEAQFELYKAEAYYNLNQEKEAFAAFEKVIEIEPDNFMAMNNYAYYLSLKGENLERAEMLSSAVVQANPDNPTYVDTHAWVLFKKKEYRLAKFYQETAIKNGGSTNPVVVEHYGDILMMLNDVDGAITNWKKSLEMGNTSETLKKKIEEKRYIEGDE